jgi:thymidylate kinase
VIIIIDGPDGSGKTTLANYLSKQLGFPIKHRSKPETEEEKKQMAQSYVDDIVSGDNIIWDRCFYSEMVYGPTMRDQSYITHGQMLSLEELLLEKGALVIYCTAPIATLWNRAQKRGESYINTFDKMAEIHDRYDHLMRLAKHLIPITNYIFRGDLNGQSTGGDTVQAVRDFL